MMPVFTSLSPNIEKEELKTVFSLLFSPWQWKKGKEIKKLEKAFQLYFGKEKVFLFNSGRAGLLVLLKALDFKPNDEILVPGFTCNALVNPILYFGLKPIFVDIEEKTLNIDPADLKRKISPKTKAVIVQHTFGLPADLERIIKICEEHNLVLIEDCAHCLGATYKGRKLGTFGKASFFSFGRDKVISCVYGGMVIVNDKVLEEKIERIYRSLGYPSFFWIFQQLLHPLLTKFFIAPTYPFFGLGRWMLIFFQKTKILSKAVSKKEKQGKISFSFAKKLPSALAKICLCQLEKLDRFLKHQKEISRIYLENIDNEIATHPFWSKERIFMRYPLLLKNKDPEKIIKKARRFGFFLDDGWRKTPIVPPDTNQQRLGYYWGTCPRAERMVKKILNVPTHINIKLADAYKIADLINKI